MGTTRQAGLLALAALLLVPGLGLGAERMLVAVQFPERVDVDVPFVASGGAPRAVVNARVEFRDGQAQIEVRYEGMKPAVLFGGDVTSFVIWAVTREGGFANLGELWVREARDSVKVSTGFKEFALVVTAETHPLVEQPSDLVMFTSGAVDSPRARSTEFAFSAFAPAAATARRSLADAPTGEEGAPDLEQAKKAFELAERAEARRYAPGLIAEAEVTLAQAVNLAAGRSTKGMRDYARRTVALASEAIRTSERTREAERLAEEIARRKAEMDTLQARMSGAEAAARAAEAQKAELEASVAEARAAMEQLGRERTRMQSDLDRIVVEAARLESEKALLESSMTELRAEREALIAERERLEVEKRQLADRLKGALDQVASTDATARGLIVNLSDILFDTNEATLKPEARVALAKLSGILLMMPELNLRIEGHTDSTGSPSGNMRLSQRRADAVFDLLASQGVSATRMKSVGYGMERPAADNTTTEGRARNRRVDVVIAEGEVQEAVSAARP